MNERWFSIETQSMVESINFHNLQNSMNQWKYLYLLNYSKICLHIILLNTCRWYHDFKFPPFSITNFSHFSVQFGCKNNIITLRLESFNVLSRYIWNIQTEHIVYIYIVYYLNPTIYIKLNCFVTKLCKCLKILLN